jgi:hypothetical protein
MADWRYSSTHSKLWSWMERWGAATCPSTPSCIKWIKRVNCASNSVWKLRRRKIFPELLQILSRFPFRQTWSLKSRPSHPVSGYVRIFLTPWSKSASELYRPSDRRFSAIWLPTFADRGCHVVSVTDPYGRILGFLDRSRYFSIK